MIISRTPLRMSFVGGGTDFREFFREHGGAVVSTAIDKWVRIVVAPRFDQGIRVSYSVTENCDTVDQVRHELVREAMRRTGVPRGVDVMTLSDVPAQGTGLGSSSAVTVGTLHALYAFQGIQRSPVELAREAVAIEVDVLGKPIGVQDQYACALGGFHLIEFGRDGQVTPRPLVATPQTFAALHRSLMLFFTGATRSADGILAGQREATVSGELTAALLRMRDLAYEMETALGEGDVLGVGDLLDENWSLKRSIAGVSAPWIDEAYARAREAGARGGKVLGAGAGGFLLVQAPAECHPAVRRALEGWREVDFRFAGAGTVISHLERL